jgi:hypothetical protein
MARINLSELLGQLDAERTQAGRSMEEWSASHRKGLVTAFEEMLTRAGLPADEVGEMKDALQGHLNTIADSAVAIHNSAGAAQHVIEKGRKRYRAALAPTGFRLD